MNRNPWDDCKTIWKDEKAYYTWLRGSVRRIWSKHPVKISYKQSKRYKAPVGVNGKEVWVIDCEICGEASRKTETDHIDGGYGFTDWESFCDWAKRILWVTFDDIRELCEECHSIVTLSQRKNITFEEAMTEKKVIAYAKEPTTRQKEILVEMGCDDIPSTKEGRKQRYREVLNETTAEN